MELERTTALRLGGGLKAGGNKQRRYKIGK